ncbi:hypothetical protein Hanom_Chr04g00357861 [Helianthus anomalus]
MSLAGTTCKTCGAVEESAAHILLQCNFAKRVWEKITSWIRIPMVNTDGNLKELLLDLNDLNRGRRMKKAIHAIAIQSMWTLFRARNQEIFGERQNTMQTVIAAIKETTFQGMRTRSKYKSITQQDWWDFNVNW